jgi:cytochrome c-type biogenesis protein CcmH/NrfG
MTSSEFLDEDADQERQARIRRRNRLTLVVLLALVLGLMLSSYPLFNHFWDPHQSQTVRSH